MNGDAGDPAGDPAGVPTPAGDDAESSTGKEEKSFSEVDVGSFEVLWL